jgi:hypothetical protein
MSYHYDPEDYQKPGAYRYVELRLKGRHVSGASLTIAEQRELKRELDLERKKEIDRRVRIYARVVWEGGDLDFGEADRDDGDGMARCSSCSREIDVANLKWKDLMRVEVSGGEWVCSYCGGAK